MSARIALGVLAATFVLAAPAVGLRTARRPAARRPDTAHHDADRPARRRRASAQHERPRLAPGPQRQPEGAARGLGSRRRIERRHRLQGVRPRQSHVIYALTRGETSHAYAARFAVTVVRARHGAAPARTHRRQRQPSLPRRNDVRRVGQPRPRRIDSRHFHHALDAGINFVDTADVYARGESEEIVGKALKGRRDSVVLATKVHGTMHDTDPNMRGNSRRWIVQEVEASLRTPADRLDRPLPDPSLGSRDRSRGDARRADGSPARGQDPLPRLVDLSAVCDRRGPVGGRAARPRALRVRAAAVLDPRAGHRDGGAADVRALRHGRDPVEPTGRRLALGQVPQGKRRDEPPSGADPGTLRPLDPREPAEARRGRAARAGRRPGRDQPDPPRARAS